MLSQLGSFAPSIFLDCTEGWMVGLLSMITTPDDSAAPGNFPRFSFARGYQCVTILKVSSSSKGFIKLKAVAERRMVNLMPTSRPTWVFGAIDLAHATRPIAGP